MKNESAGTYLLLAALSDVYWLNVVYSALILNVYLVTLLANLLLLTLQKFDAQLHTPMYFFLSHLSFIDICFPTSVVPRILSSTFTGDLTISIVGCAIQMFFALGLGSTECLLLAIMAFDRYVAICQPLRYHILMSKRICYCLITACWLISFMSSLLHTVFTFLMPFCKARETRHFGCEIQAVMKLSCANTHTHEIWLFATAIAVALCSFLLTMFSYVHIISAILKIQSAEGKSKVFSTCSSHLIVVSMFYGTIISIYMRPISSYDPERDRGVALIYGTVAPMINPLIYSIRNKEVKCALKKFLAKACNTSGVPKTEKISSMKK